MKTTTAMLRAQIIETFGNIDLKKDFFELSCNEMDNLKKFKKAFGFSGKNNLGRSELRQFYYHLQKGYNKLPF